jgi:hypothetical protein
MIFQNPVSNWAASPPEVPPELTEMPAVIIDFCVPEPNTWALAGIGFLILQVCAHRKRVLKKTSE